MKKYTTISVIAASLFLAGCATGGTKQTVGTFAGAAGGALLGSQFGGGSGQIVGAVLGTVGGALAGGAIGKHMDETGHKEEEVGKKGD